MQQKFNLIDESDYPDFWLPKHWAIKNTIAGIPLVLSKIDVHKYEGDTLGSFWAIMQIDSELVKKYMRIKPNSFKEFGTEKLHKKLVIEHPNFFTQHDINRINSSLWGTPFGHYPKNDVINKKWLKSWNEVHKELTRRRYD